MKDEKGTWKLLFIYLFIFKKKQNFSQSFKFFFFALTFVCSLTHFLVFVCLFLFLK